MKVINSCWPKIPSLCRDVIGIVDPAEWIFRQTPVNGQVQITVPLDNEPNNRPLCIEITSEQHLLGNQKESNRKYSTTPSRLVKVKNTDQRYTSRLGKVKNMDQRYTSRLGKVKNMDQWSVVTNERSTRKLLHLDCNGWIIFPGQTDNVTEVEYRAVRILHRIVTTAG